MAITFDKQTKFFHLTTKNTSYLFGIFDNNYLYSPTMVVACARVPTSSACGKNIRRVSLRTMRVRPMWITHWT